MAFVAAFGCFGDVQDEPHVISPSARAWLAGFCLQGTPVPAEVTDWPAWLAPGISLGFSLGWGRWAFLAADQGGQLGAAVAAELGGGGGGAGLGEFAAPSQLGRGRGAADSRGEPPRRPP